MMSDVDRTWYVYILRCADKTQYCGITNDLKKRLQTHNAGKGAKYTRSRLPVRISCQMGGLTRSEAAKLEYRIKQLPAHEKERFLTSQIVKKNCSPEEWRLK